jgi:hypothetical protein
MKTPLTDTVVAPFDRAEREHPELVALCRDLERRFSDVTSKLEECGITTNGDLVNEVAALADLRDTWHRKFFEKSAYAEHMREALKKAYYELNAIHYGWKSSITQEYFTSVVEECRAALAKNPKEDGATLGTTYVMERSSARFEEWWRRESRAEEIAIILRIKSACHAAWDAGLSTFSMCDECLVAGHCVKVTTWNSSGVDKP